MNTIIEKVSAEVLRLIRESEGPGSQYGFGMMSACNRILNFLDTIQVQPVCEELGREMDRFFTSKEYAEAEKAGFGEAHAARHFAQWGAEHFRDTTKKMEKDKITWKDIQDILLLDESIMLERFSKTGRIRALSQRHCREVLRKLKKEREGEK